MVVEVTNVLVGSSSRGSVVLVPKKQKVSQIVWVARDLSDCTNDAEAFHLALIKSIDYRCKLGLHECHLLDGDKSNEGSPYRVASLNRWENVNVISVVTNVYVTSHFHNNHNRNGNTTLNMYSQLLVCGQSVPCLFKILWKTLHLLTLSCSSWLPQG